MNSTEQDDLPVTAAESAVRPSLNEIGEYHLTLPRFPKTFTYASPNRADGLVSLHYNWRADPPMPDTPPILLTVRHGIGTLPERFTFTQSGRPSEPEPCRMTIDPADGHTMRAAGQGIWFGTAGGSSSLRAAIHRRWNSLLLTDVMVARASAGYGVSGTTP